MLSEFEQIGVRPCEQIASLCLLHLGVALLLLESNEQTHLQLYLSSLQDSNRFPEGQSLLVVQDNLPSSGVLKIDVEQ